MFMFEKGFGAVDHELKQMKANEENRKNEANKFWLKYGESRNVIFLEDEPVIFYEHRFIYNDDWRNAVTKVCLRKLGKCPGCESGNKAQIRAAFSVSDLTSWTDKEGKTHKSQKRLLILGATQAEKLNQLYEGNGHKLRGFQVKIGRGTDKKENKTGTSFLPCTKEGKVVWYNLDEWLKKGADVKPFDYSKVIKMGTYEEFAEYLKKPSAFDPGDQPSVEEMEHEGEPKDDDVPF